VHRIEIHGVALPGVPVARLPATQIPGIVVQRPSVDPANLIFSFARDLLKKSPRPLAVIAVGPGGDEFQWSVTRHPGCESAVLGCVLLWREVPTASPGFVTDAPVAHIERLFESGSGTLIGKRGAPGG